MIEQLSRLQEVIYGPQPVRWAGDLYATDVEFRLALEDGVPPRALERAAERATSKTEFRERVLDAYYEQI